MSEHEENKPFVVNDRRKFRMDGEPVSPPVAAPEAAEAPSARVEDVKPAPIPFPVRDSAPQTTEAPTNSAHMVTPVPEPAEHEVAADAAADGEEGKLPPPTAEEMEQVRSAYEATAERLDTMMRSQNLGGEHMPPMDFNQLVQSIYMSAMIQMGAGTQQGQQARVDLIGAKNSIDMLSVIEEKSSGNLLDQEKNLLNAALFELRMGFLEITQLLARQAQARATTPPPPGGAPPAGGGFSGGGGFTGGGFSGGGPRIVR